MGTSLHVGVSNDLSHRHSVPDLECCLATLRPLINQLGDRAREACHRANQLLLLRDMLDTRQCSPLLLPESPSEAWVENVVHKRVTENITASEPRPSLNMHA